MLKFYVRHDMVVDKIHEIISFKQSKWLKNSISLLLKNEILLKKNLKKTSIKYLITHFMEKQWKMYEIVKD